VVNFEQTREANQIEHAVGPVFPKSGVAPCAILTGLAKDAPELENQLLYVAEKWLTLAIIGEQLSSGADRALHKLFAPN
jgi:hypothetical protein